MRLILKIRYEYTKVNRNGKSNECYFINRTCPWKVLTLAPQASLVDIFHTNTLVGAIVPSIDPSHEASISFVEKTSFPQRSKIVSV